MKKAMMPIRLTFLLVIGVIAAFLIIGMLIDWAFNAGKMMDRITKGEDAIPDNQKIDASYTSNCQQVIIKYAKLCHAKVTQEQIPAGLCYAIYSCQSSVDPNAVMDAIRDAFGPFEPDIDAEMAADITFTGGSGSRATIRYEGHLVIE